MRFILKWLAALVVGVAIGVASLYYMAFQAHPDSTVANGIWRTDLAAGSVASEPYARLYAAITAILALNRSESIYFEARTDSEGGALSAACDYVLSGPPPPARWWSVTAYGANNLLIPSLSGRYSVSTATSETRADGSLDIALTPEGSGPNGIATGSGRFTLLLRLYQPAPDLVASPDSTPLFQIAKGSCRA